LAGAPSPPLIPMNSNKGKLSTWLLLCLVSIP
jgi:hypothetical protein